MYVVKGLVLFPLQANKGYNWWSAYQSKRACRHSLENCRELAHSCPSKPLDSGHAPSLHLSVFLNSEWRTWRGPISLIHSCTPWGKPGDAWNHKSAAYVFSVWLDSSSFPMIQSSELDSFCCRSDLQKGQNWSGAQVLLTPNLRVPHFDPPISDLTLSHYNQAKPAHPQLC